MKKQPTIAVIGSTNTDMVIATSRIPAPGETILGGNFFMNPGGKGANQAVAAARLGAHVVFISKLGEDIFGDASYKNLAAENIETQFLLRDKIHPSGVAMITVDATGENSIVVAPGANNQLIPADIDFALAAILTADIIVMQMEIPMQTILHVATIAKQHYKKLLLNPAPASVLPDEILSGLFAITPNETEAEVLTGIALQTNDNIYEAAALLKQKGVQHVIITLGAEGVFIMSDDFTGHIATEKVTAVDTTAAGDVFTAALAVALANNSKIEDAATFACKAATISVTRKGAQASTPYIHEVQ